MNASSNLILRKSYSRKDKTHPIYLRLTINRKSKYFSTEIWCKEDQWDKKNKRLYKNVKNSVIYNLKLSDKETKAQTILNNFIRFSKPPTFIEFTTQFNVSPLRSRS